MSSLKVSAMTIVVNLTPELEEILRDLAHSQGQDVTSIASELLSQVLLMDKQRLAEAEEIQSRELAALLQKFEDQYQMDSQSFYQKFQAGTIGDSADFFEWNTYYEMLNGSQVAV
jgi:transcription initiation factor IIE alpha subunit